MSEAEARAERRFRKLLEDSWHELRVVQQETSPGEHRLLLKIVGTQQAILEALYFVRTGRFLAP